MSALRLMDLVESWMSWAALTQKREVGRQADWTVSIEARRWEGRAVGEEWRGWTAREEGAGQPHPSPAAVRAGLLTGYEAVEGGIV